MIELSIRSPLRFDDCLSGATLPRSGFRRPGSVTSGELTGGVITIVVLYPPFNPLQCLTSQGLTTEPGTMAVQITVAS